jgi:DNA-binding transcriptional LysR family regulator
VVVLPSDHPLAAADAISIDDLRAERFITMRAGYLMHRFVHRLFGSEMPASTHTTDGAEMGKVMVAEGLGVTVLPDYSVAGDPLVRAGLITTRRLAGVHTPVTLALHQKRSAHVPSTVRDLVTALVEQARSVAGGTP